MRIIFNNTSLASNYLFAYIFLQYKLNVYLHNEAMSQINCNATLGLFFNQYIYLQFLQTLGQHFKNSSKRSNPLK